MSNLLSAFVLKLIHHPVEVKWYNTLIEPYKQPRCFSQAMGLLTVARSQTPGLFLKDVGDPYRSTPITPRHSNISPELCVPAPDSWEVCAHDIIHARCRGSPGSQAVVSCDGSFTYRELDELSIQVACMLRWMGVKPETFVPICMDKSRWTVVAMLGVMKSGAAFTLLDPSYPMKRIESICQDLSCSFILSDQSRGSPLATISNVICVEQAVSAWHAHSQQDLSPTASPGNALYVSFTSGSTGRPKGIVIEHRAYCSGARPSHSIIRQDNTVDRCQGRLDSCSRRRGHAAV